MPLILTNNLIEVADAEITARSVATGFEKANVMDFWRLKRRLRADDLLESNINPLIYFDLGAVTTVVAVFLNDVNFDTTWILGDNADLGVNWAGAAFNSGSVSPISLDERVNRYKLFLPLTGFNYQYLAVMTPNPTGAVGSYTTKWELGTVGIIASYDISSLKKATYERTTKEAFKDIPLRYGGNDRIGLGDVPWWEGTVTVEKNAEEDEGAYWTLNGMSISLPLILYENETQDDKAYLCLRYNEYIGTRHSVGLVRGNSIKFKELI